MVAGGSEFSAVISLSLKSNYNKFMQHFAASSHFLSITQSSGTHSTLLKLRKDPGLCCIAKLKFSRLSNMVSCWEQLAVMGTCQELQPFLHLQNKSLQYALRAGIRLQDSLDATVTRRAGQHTYVRRRKEIIAIKTKTEVTLVLLSTTGDGSWRVKD